jgi:hypothetical protein
MCKRAITIGVIPARREASNPESRGWHGGWIPGFAGCARARNDREAED